MIYQVFKKRIALRNAEVVGSNPIISTNKINMLQNRAGLVLVIVLPKRDITITLPDNPHM